MKVVPFVLALVCSGWLLVGCASTGDMAPAAALDELVSGKGPHAGGNLAADSLGLDWIPPESDFWRAGMREPEALDIVCGLYDGLVFLMRYEERGDLERDERLAVRRWQIVAELAPRLIGLIADGSVVCECVFRGGYYIYPSGGMVVWDPGSGQLLLTIETQRKRWTLHIPRGACSR